MGWRQIDRQHILLTPGVECMHTNLSNSGSSAGRHQIFPAMAGKQARPVLNTSVHNIQTKAGILLFLHLQDKAVNQIL